MATSEAQKRANRKYRLKNKEKERIASYKRVARLFVRQYATASDMEELNNLFSKRQKS